MLEITIKKTNNEIFDNKQNIIITNEKDVILQLEHSLVSISKWESKWHKPFLSNEKKTQEELLDYIKCMTITQNVNDHVYYFLSNENIQEINKYIEDPMSATTFSNYRSNNYRNKSSRDKLTSELIYYWMVTYNIPYIYQKWHLNRLLTLIRICSIKNSNETMSKKDLASQNRALNQARRARLGTKG